MKTVPESLIEVRKHDEPDYRPLISFSDPGAWHSHTFSEDVRVLIVEHRDTAEATLLL
jgi:hypothetical protein